MAPGALVISIDVELAWGTCDRPLGPGARRRLGAERAVVRRLLELFARYEVRATWAVVGHLLLDRCGGDGARAHPEIPRPVQPGRPDWFLHHPRGADPLWCARDVVALVRAARPAQEIGSHSFCHVPYAEGVTARAAVVADVEAARRCHAAAGLPFESFVFPRNAAGYHDVLAAAGVVAYRGRPATWYDAIPVGRARRLLDLLAFLTMGTPATVVARRDAGGLVDVPASMLLYRRRGPARLLRPATVAARVARALGRAAERGEIFHLWFHPANFVDRPLEQFGVLERILREAARLGQAGRLEILTMADIARRLDAAAPAPAAGVGA